MMQISYHKTFSYVIPMDSIIKALQMAEILVRWWCT